MTAADLLAETLMDWGVEVIFGLHGDGINGVMEALRTRQDKIRFVQVRHEESAAFMACGYAKLTGKSRCLFGSYEYSTALKHRIVIGGQTKTKTFRHPDQFAAEVI